MAEKEFGLYKEVQLAKDLPEYGFIKGDVATIIEIIEKPGKPTGYCLEFFDSQGNTLNVVVAGEDSIMPPIVHGVVHYREYSM